MTGTGTGTEEGEEGVHTVEVGEASLDGGYGHVLCVFTVQSSPGAEPEPTSNKRESLCIA